MRNVTTAGTVMGALLGTPRSGARIASVPRLAPTVFV